VILQWLQEQYRCPVVAFGADVGQGDEVKELKEKAMATGASEVVVEDLREEFVKNMSGLPSGPMRSMNRAIFSGHPWPGH